MVPSVVHAIEFSPEVSLLIQLNCNCCDMCKIPLWLVKNTPNFYRTVLCFSVRVSCIDINLSKYFPLSSRQESQKCNKDFSSSSPDIDTSTLLVVGVQRYCFSCNSVRNLSVSLSRFLSAAFFLTLGSFMPMPLKSVPLTSCNPSNWPGHEKIFWFSKRKLEIILVLRNALIRGLFRVKWSINYPVFQAILHPGLENVNLY